MINRSESIEMWAKHSTQTSVGRYHGTTVELRYFFFTVPVPSRSQYYMVPQYHKYHGTTVRYLPTNHHFSEDFRAKKSLFTGWINWKSSNYL